jgi:3-oxoacyl-[acyl-carrier protein] reductase
MTRFNGKVVFVTGAGVGIGYALCHAFASEGAIVALNDVDPKLATHAAAKINDDLGFVCVYPYGFDVSDVSASRSAVQDTVNKFGHLDVAIANAGITHFSSFLQYKPEDFDRLLGVNLRGSYFTAQAAAQVMVERQIEGRLILMSSVTGVQAINGTSAYAITKAGIRMMARSLALELGEYGITVNAIAPGATLTERTMLETADYEANWVSVTPNREVGRVDDVAATALFLASPEAHHINGQTIVVDGGWTIYSPTTPDYNDH